MSTPQPSPLSIIVSTITNDSPSQSDIYKFEPPTKQQRSSSIAPSIPTVFEVIPIPSQTSCYCRFLWNNELHGLTAVLKSPTWSIKIFWSLVIFIALVIATWMTHDVIYDYFTYTTATRITIKRESSLMYPTVVLCPKNADALNMTAVRADIDSKLSPLDNATINNLIAFAIAGAGFDNFDSVIANFTDTQLQKLSTYFERWKAHLSLGAFYTKLFEQFGYRCTDFFYSCHYGSQSFDCCKLFTPVYVAFRGRCFQLRNYYQNDPDEVGRISIYVNRLGSPIIGGEGGLQSQSVVYISDKSPEIGFYPHFYLSYLQWNRMRFTRSHIHMQPISGQCAVDTTSEDGQSRDTCIVEAWLHDRVVKPFNCTLFYFASKTPKLPICSPGLVVNNYASIGNLSISTQRCLPACSRFDTSIDFFSTKQTSDDWSNSSIVPAFRLEASYTYLQYESYQEVLQTSGPNFISKIGGQFGLFCGISVITIIQVLMSFSQYIYTRVKALVTDEPPVYYGTLKQ